MADKKIVIAVDGFSSCGKSTLAKDLAHELGYLYIDSGAMYRAVTLFSLEQGIIGNIGIDIELLKSKLNEITIWFENNPATGKSETILNGQNIEKEIRTIHVSNNVSRISELGFVREKLVKLQQEMGLNKGIVMDGRDIGTVVFPNAELKLFMTADPEVRAHRRYDEIIAKGDKITLDEIRENLTQRDFIDQNREISPLTKASDAIVLDNSFMTQKQQLDWILERMTSLKK